VKQERGKKMGSTFHLGVFSWERGDKTVTSPTKKGENATSGGGGDSTRSSLPLNTIRRNLDIRGERPNSGRQGGGAAEGPTKKRTIVPMYWKPTLFFRNGDLKGFAIYDWSTEAPRRRGSTASTKRNRRRKDKWGKRCREGISFRNKSRKRE